MKFKLIVVHENNSHNFDIGHSRTNFKVTARLLHFSPFTAIQNVRSHNSTYVQARKLLSSVYVYLIIIYKFIVIATVCGVE